MHSKSNVSRKVKMSYNLEQREYLLMNQALGFPDSLFCMIFVKIILTQLNSDCNTKPQGKKRMRARDAEIVRSNRSVPTISPLHYQFRNAQWKYKDFF